MRWDRTEIAMVTSALLAIWLVLAIALGLAFARFGQSDSACPSTLTTIAKDQSRVVGQ